MTFSEQGLAFDCEGDPLCGIACVPQHPLPVGVVIVVGGPQYRAGSHRQFTQLARSLASAGHPTLRFDVRGMGDSQGAQRTFENLDADIASAINALTHHVPGTDGVVLWGLCDGASAALLYVQRQRDRRVAGLALLNPWVRSEASLARTHVKHYYRKRLLERAFWTRLLSGRVAASALSDLVRTLRTSRGSSSAGPVRFQDLMAEGWTSAGCPILLLISETDLTALEFVEFTSGNALWQRAMQAHPETRVKVRGADHTCSTPGAKLAVEQASVQWLGTVHVAQRQSRSHAAGEPAHAR